LNLTTQENCFGNWLASQTDDDLRQALGADVGPLIKDHIRREIERRNMTAVILPFTHTDQMVPLVDTNFCLDQNR